MNWKIKITYKNHILVTLVYKLKYIYILIL